MYKTILHHLPNQRLVKYKQNSIKSRNENTLNSNKKSLMLYVFLKSYNI